MIPRMESAETSGATRRVALIAAATASFVVTFMGSSVNIALPTIAREFSLDAVTLSWGHHLVHPGGSNVSYPFR